MTRPCLAWHSQLRQCRYTKRSTACAVWQLAGCANEYATTCYAVHSLADTAGLCIYSNLELIERATPGMVYVSISCATSWYSSTAYWRFPSLATYPVPRELLNLRWTHHKPVRIANLCVADESGLSDAQAVRERHGSVHPLGSQPGRDCLGFAQSLNAPTTADITSSIFFASWRRHLFC